jgi:hypothetical protein
LHPPSRRSPVSTAVQAQLTIRGDSTASLPKPNHERHDSQEGKTQDQCEQRNDLLGASAFYQKEQNAGDDDNKESEAKGRLS